MTARTMAFTVIDRLFVAVYGREGPTDDEWAAFVLQVARHGVERTHHIVFTDGGGPDRAQRRDLARLLGVQLTPVAVISERAAVRAVVTVVSWINGNIRAFRPAELVDALVFLETPTSRAGLIEREAAKLRVALGRPTVG